MHTTLPWCYNEHDSILNHCHQKCLLNRLLRRRSKKTSKLLVTGLCEGNSPVTGEFPTQRASNAKKGFHLMMSSWTLESDLLHNTSIYMVDSCSAWLLQIIHVSMGSSVNALQRKLLATACVVRQSRFKSIWHKVMSGLAAAMTSLIARFIGPTWGPSGADRTQVGPMLAPWTLLSEMHLLRAHATPAVLLSLFCGPSATSHLSHAHRVPFYAPLIIPVDILQCKNVALQHMMIFIFTQLLFHMWFFHFWQKCNHKLLGTICLK